MIRPFLIMGLVLTYGLASAQWGEVRGRVVDSKTNESLPFANVFINNTTMGSAANEDGYFRLVRVPAGQIELICSYVGYLSYQKTVQLEANQTLEITVSLMPDEKLLENVQVQGSRDKKWEGQMKRFTRVFLGGTKRAAQCRILNPWVLEFKEEGAAIFAEASAPLEIENDALGYWVTYILQKYIEKSGAYTILGNVQFEEKKSPDPLIEARWERNRREVYAGSQRHMFKSILKKNATEEGFKFYNDKIGFENSPRSSVFAAELGKSIEEFHMSGVQMVPDLKTGSKRLILKRRIEIHYHNASPRLRTYDDLNAQVSWIDLKNGSIRVNAAGAVIDLDNIVTSGYMGTLRIADLLPNDYLPGKQKSGLLHDSLSISVLNDLQEKVHLTTDRPYYYQGDMIWFKGLMKYSDLQKRDTLSTVLYVDLIDSAKRIIQSKCYPLEDGRVGGDLFLTENLTPGRYYLRAYTNWMRNFDPRNFFVKGIQVLAANDKVVSSPVETPKASSGSVLTTIQPDKEKYAVREKVSLTIQVKDLAGAPELAELSVSVTDMNQVVPMPEDTFGTDEFSALTGQRLITPYPVEYGISLGGTFTGLKGKKERAVITTIKGKQELMTTMATDDQGKFWLTGFHFNDSSEFAFQVRDKKGKPYGNIQLSNLDPPAVNDLPDFLPLKRQSATSSQHQMVNYTFFGKGKVLDEARVSAILAGDFRPDFSVQKVNYKAEDFGQLLELVQRKASGPTKKSANSGDPDYYGWSARQEPKLIIDGQPFASTQTKSVARRLAQIDQATVDHAELLKYNALVQIGSRGSQEVIIMVYLKNKPSKPGLFDRQYFQVKKLRGYAIPTRFTSPDYGSAKEDHSKPDLRSTIYWNPSKVTDHAGQVLVSFYTADLAAPYKISVDGITSEGILFHAERIIEIK